MAKAINLRTDTSNLACRFAGRSTDKGAPAANARELRCPLNAGCRDARLAEHAANRQRVSAGARASPSWIGGRRRPTCLELCGYGWMAQAIGERYWGQNYRLAKRRDFARQWKGITLVQGADLLGIIAMPSDLKPRTGEEICWKFFDGVLNCLRGVGETAVPQSSAPLRCVQLSRCRIVKAKHDATICCWAAL